MSYWALQFPGGYSKASTVRVAGEWLPARTALHQSPGGLPGGKAPGAKARCCLAAPTRRSGADPGSCSNSLEQEQVVSGMCLAQCPTLMGGQFRSYPPGIELRCESRSVD